MAGKAEVGKNRYNRLTDALLAGVEVRTGIDFLQYRDELLPLADKVLYTGAIDAWFDHRLGHLEYRTVRFETEVLSTCNHQGVAVMNYTDAQVPYTRIIEHKHFESFGADVEANPRTVVSREYSTEWMPGMEPYYPVNDAANTALLASLVITSMRSFSLSTVSLEGIITLPLCHRREMMNFSWVISANSLMRLLEACRIAGRAGSRGR